MRVLTLLVILLATAAVNGQTISGFPPADGGYDRDRITALDDAIKAEKFKLINSVVVIRDGGLLIERYYNGVDRDTTHNPRSVGKTFVTPLLGIAIEEGYIDSLDQALGDFYDLAQYEHPSAKKAAVTLRQLLTMSSGFEGYDFEPTSPGNEENMYPQPDWVRWTLNLPMADDRQPGDAWRYFTAGVVLLGDILNRHVPGGLENYAHEKLFEPLGISNYEWQHTPQRVANTAGGVQLTPLGFAKFGELHRTHGRWGSKQVVPAHWTREALRPRVDTTVEGNRYGYLWWHKTYELDGEDWTFAYCSGNGGNKIFVSTDRSLVIVVTASAYGQRYAHAQVDEMMRDFILPAVRTR